MTKSSASLAAYSWRWRSTPRTQNPSDFRRLTRCPPMKPPAPHTKAVRIVLPERQKASLRQFRSHSTYEPSTITISERSDGVERINLPLLRFLIREENTNRTIPLRQP